MAGNIKNWISHAWHDDVGPGMVRGLFADFDQIDVSKESAKNFFKYHRSHLPKRTTEGTCDSPYMLRRERDVNG